LYKSYAVRHAFPPASVILLDIRSPPTRPIVLIIRIIFQPVDLITRCLVLHKRQF
jgi:hypothetical protein